MSAGMTVLRADVGTSRLAVPVGWGVAAAALFVATSWSFGTTALTMAVALGLATAVTVALSRELRHELGMLWAVVAVGTAVQSSLGVDHEAVLAIVIAAPIAFVLARGVTTGLLTVHLGEASATKWSAVLLVGAIALRLLPVTQGSLSNGRLVIGEVSLQVGEFTEIVVLVGAGILVWQFFASVGVGRMTRREASWYAACALALAANLGLLLVVDTGPAIVIAFAVVVMALLSARAMRVSLLRIDWWAAIIAFVSIMVVLAARLGVTDRLEERFQNVLEPGYQLGVAKEAMQQGGLVGAGLGSSPLAPYVSLNTTDFLPAAVGAELGLVVLAGLVAVLVIALMRIAAAARGRQNLSGLLVVGLIAASACQAVITVAGVLGAIPLTGLSTPALTVTGSTLLPTMIVLGVASAVLGSDSRKLTMDLSERPRLSALGLAAVASVVATCVILAATSTSANAYAVLMPRGDILTRDGAVIATSTEDGDREYPDAGLYSELGWMIPGYAAYGLESSGSRILTCGARHTIEETVLQVVRPLPCHPADLVTTIDSRVQAALRDALAGYTAQGVVTDSWTGEVLALYSSPSVGAEEQVTGAVPEQLSMREGSSPGSTFKIITAASALLMGIDTFGAPDTEFEVGGSVITNAFGFTCADTSVETMITQSCNTTAAYIAVAAGQDGLSDIATRYFGADLDPGFDAGPAEKLVTGLKAGSLSDPQLARTGFGQESVQASAFAIASVTGLVARAAADQTAGSAAPSLHVISGACSSSGLSAEPVAPAFGGQLSVIPQDVARVILGGMTEPVESGLAGPLSALETERSLAVKTGTAEVANSTTGFSRIATVVVDSRWVVSIVVEEVTASEASPAVTAAASVVGQLPNDMLDPMCEG